MDLAVKNSLSNLVKTFCDLENVDLSNHLEELISIFESHSVFMEKLRLLDDFFDDHVDLDPIREYAFDLFLTNFLADDVTRLESDYLESPEWEKIEEKTLDRGTELLNLLLYLRECEDEEIEPSLEDFLKEFLLVEEDEFQDEFRIYETVLENQNLVEASFEQIGDISKKLDPESELQDLFYPLMAFFNTPQPNQEEYTKYLKNAEDQSLQGALYQLMINFK